jgi:hypothetical protein
MAVIGVRIRDYVREKLLIAAVSAMSLRVPVRLLRVLFRKFHGAIAVRSKTFSSSTFAPPIIAFSKSRPADHFIERPYSAQLVVRMGATRIE